MKKITVTLSSEKPKAKKVAVVAMIRINTRVRPDQSKFIKALAKKENANGIKPTEGDIIRMMIDTYIGKHK